MVIPINVRPVARGEEIGSSSTPCLCLGVVFVFLILAAQYESWDYQWPSSQLVPFAIFGAILGVWLRGLENDVYFQIGLVTLVGLARQECDPHC